MTIRSLIRHIILNFLSINSVASNYVHILNGHFISKNLNKDSKSFFENFIIRIKNYFEIIDLDTALNINKKRTL